jgi:hypothetical protein
VEWYKGNYLNFKKHIVNQKNIVKQFIVPIKEDLKKFYKNPFYMILWIILIFIASF